jgi:outer membrane biogenesis lipoprotein LolB
MKRTKNGALVAVLACALLSACASTGTRVTTTSDTYKSMARGQQGWCSQFGCGCQLDGQPATCSLVQTCITTGSCEAAR